MRLRRCSRWSPLLVLTSVTFANQPPPSTAPGQDSAEPSIFAAIQVVEAATLHTQTLEEAPANVTVVTAAEIRKYGYRTLGEALSSVRGFYFSNDRMYDFAGVRGLSIPGDYNSRFLIMLNGHPLPENIYNSTNFFGQDFGLDMDLVERIEVIRGPSSALYGSNGMLANINIVTKSPVDMPKFQATTELGSFGEKKALMSSSMDLGKGVNLLVSASIFNHSGRSLYFPEYDTPETGGGIAHGVDAQRGYHSFANLVWGRWNVTGYFNTREIRVPVGGSGGVFGSTGNRVEDSRGFVGANYTREVRNGARIRWQLHYDQYRYSDRFDYPLEDDLVQDNRTGNWGDWVSSQFSYSVPVRRLGTLTMGLLGSYELRNLQRNWDAAPVPAAILDVRFPDRTAAVFAQQEYQVARTWKAYFGVRLDESRNFGRFASPRLALVHQPSDRTSVKLVYGRPFRNASAFERYYDDGLAYAANPNLGRETANAWEVSVERKVASELSLLVNAFDYRLRNVIEAAWISDVVTQYRNSGSRRASGVEFEVRGRPRWWLETTGSFVVQRTSRQDTGLRLANSPARVGKARVAVPLVKNRLYLSGGLQYLSSRATRVGTDLRPVALVDLNVASVRLFRGYDLVCGVRNGLNWQFDHPVDLSVDQIRANGRTFFVKLVWQQGD